jgi:hypothetical protein
MKDDEIGENGKEGQKISKIKKYIISLIKKYIS